MTCSCLPSIHPQAICSPCMARRKQTAATRLVDLWVAPSECGMCFIANWRSCDLKKCWWLFTKSTCLMSVTYGWTLKWGHANMDKLIATGIRKRDPKRTMFCHLNQTEQHGTALRSNACCFLALILLSKLSPKRAAESTVCFAGAFGSQRGSFKAPQLARF